MKSCCKTLGFPPRLATGKRGETAAPKREQAESGCVLERGKEALVVDEINHGVWASLDPGAAAVGVRGKVYVYEWSHIYGDFTACFTAKQEFDDSLEIRMWVDYGRVTEYYPIVLDPTLRKDSQSWWIVAYTLYELLTTGRPTADHIVCSVGEESRTEKEKTALCSCDDLFSSQMTVILESIVESPKTLAEILREVLPEGHRKIALPWYFHEDFR